MDPVEGNDHRFAENHAAFEDTQAREKSQGKKYRHNVGDNNPVQGAVSRPKQRAPGNLTTNGICPNSAEAKFNNCSKCEATDPYSVSYNVDSKTSIDKCSSKIDRADRSGEGYPGCCSWSLEGLLAHDEKINNTETEVTVKLNNCEPQQNSAPNRKSENTQNGLNQNDFNINVPSTSSSNRAAPSTGSSGSRGSRKRSAQSSRKVREAAELPLPYADDSSSDTGNDDYSVGSDECCIYTYRGGEHLADLPSSFFSLDMGLAEGAALPAPPLFAPRVAPPAAPSRNSSPDMDYLEMDFDPGPSCEADSDRESSLDLDLDATQPDDHHSDNENSLPPHVSDPIQIEVKPPENNSIPNRVSIDQTPSLATAANSPTTAAVEVAHIVPAAPIISATPSTSGRGLSPIPSTSGTCHVSVTREVEVTEKVVEAEEEAAQLEHAGLTTLIAHTLPSGEVVCVRRTCRSWPVREGPGHHSSSGDLISPGDTAECELPESLLWSPAAAILGECPSVCHSESGRLTLDMGRLNPELGRASLLEAGRHNLASALFHCTMAKRLTVHRTDNFLHDQDTSNVDGVGVSVERPLAVPKSMVWSEQEACCRQVTQIGTSACGATAVINALMGLNQPVEIERILAAVLTRSRACSAPLPRYLVSRALAGCNAVALAAGLRTQHVHCRHFRTWPERALSLSHWLAYWIGLGAVPIVTLNLQSGVLDPMRTPDSWHHQMVFGVGPRGVYLTNPLECVDEGALWHHLCSDSVLLVRRKDIVSRWTCNTDLSPLLTVPGDPRWRTMNVLGQVVNVIRESHTSSGSTHTSHVRIPACYEAGVTIAAVFGSEAHRRLLLAPELPLLHQWTNRRTSYSESATN